jgi:ADP-ribosylarginine hydrolase
MSSTNQQTKNNNNDYIISIEEILQKARNKVFNTLTIQYNYDDDTAKKIEESINISTRSTMRDKYTFHDGPLTFNFGKYNEYFEKLILEVPDFANWIWITLSIPFYQSIGDTIGYNNGKWEFNYGNVREGPEYVNELIYEYIYLGGINDLNIKNWKASDDSILYLATMDILVSGFESIDDFGNKLKKSYLKSVPLIKNRHAGETTMNSLEIQKKTKEWNKIPYNKKSIGAGSAMRSGCIGIFFPGTNNRKRLVALSIESSRITHNSAIAMLGSITAALFTAYALEKVPIDRWVNKLLKLLGSDIVDEYLKQSRPDEYKFYAKDKRIYIGKWEKYRDLLLGQNFDIKLMRNTVQRYKYLIENFSIGCDIPGSCGDDALIMAYDSLARCDGTLEKILVYSILHPGDSDTVGSVAFSWYGGFYNSPRNEFFIGDMKKNLEFYDKISNLMEKTLPLMTKIYFFDIYINVAKKYLKQYVSNVKKQ